MGTSPVNHGNFMRKWDLSWDFIDIFMSISWDFVVFYRHLIGSFDLETYPLVTATTL